jgi:hypothetical protein
MNAPQSLLLQETGIARLADGGEAVNVGPIVAALAFLTEGRGEDRGTDEQGVPLPDLLSLAFDVLQAIILGGRRASYLREVKRAFDSEFGLEGRASVALAKQAAAVKHDAANSALERAAAELRSRLARVDQSSLEGLDSGALKEAVEGFRGFGVDRWVTATSHLILALRALPAPHDTAPAPPARRAKAKRAAASRSGPPAASKRARRPSKSKKAEAPREVARSPQPKSAARQVAARPAKRGGKAKSRPEERPATIAERGRATKSPARARRKR